jgi:hypothetical protein
MAVRLSALHAGSALPPELSCNDFCSKLSKSQGHDVAGRLRQMEKNSMTSSGLQPRDLPVCSKATFKTKVNYNLIKRKLGGKTVPVFN